MAIHNSIHNCVSHIDIVTNCLILQGQNIYISENYNLILTIKSQLIPSHSRQTVRQSCQVSSMKIPCGHIQARQIAWFKGLLILFLIIIIMLVLTGYLFRNNCVKCHWNEFDYQYLRALQLSLLQEQALPKIQVLSGCS